MDPLLAATLVVLGVAAAPYVCYLALYAVVRPSGSPANERPREPTVSVVLPTYNEAEIVETKLEDLLALDYPDEKVEVVVVDSSSDDTRSIVRDFFTGRDAPSLTLIEEDERRGLAPALNDAYEAAANEVVVKTDCDSKLAPDALREATATLADDEVAAVTGRNAEVLGGSDVERGYRGVQGQIQRLESHLDSTLIFHGPFSAFENDAILPIDPDSAADDTELALKIRRQGKRVVYDPAVRYKEAAHSAFLKRRTQKDRRAMGLLRLLIQHRDALGRYGRYGRVVLPFNWWFMFVSPLLVVAATILGTGAAVAAVGPVGVALPAGLVAFAWLGGRDALGPLQPAYALLDTQVSLLGGLWKLARDDSDGTWEVDSELREAYD